MNCADPRGLAGMLTVFFDKPFWVGVFEVVSCGRLSVAKVTFGAEPKDFEIYEFILKNYYKLDFSDAVKTDVKTAAKNPKRVQRDVHKAVHNSGIGTKAQQALAAQREQFKTLKKNLSREKREEKQRRLFELKQKKKKEKHKGR